MSTSNFETKHPRACAHDGSCLKKWTYHAEALAKVEDWTATRKNSSVAASSQT